MTAQAFVALTILAVLAIVAACRDVNADRRRREERKYGEPW